jgi:HK97 family phage major capsid protein
MSDEIKSLRDDIGRTHEEYKKALDVRDAEVKKLGETSAETTAKLAKMDEMFDRTEKALQEIEKSVKRAEIPAGETKTSEQKLAERKAFLDFALKGHTGLTKTFHPGVEQKVLSSGDATTGGVFAMPEILSGMLRAVVELSPFRQNATVRTTSKESVQLRKEIQTGSASWVGEQATRSETQNPRYGWEIVPLHELYAMIDITRWDLEDADFNWESELNYQASTQFAVAESSAFHSGNGVGKPNGFIDVPATSTLGNDVFTGDDLIEMVAALKTAYHANAKWYMRRATIAEARKLKGSTNDHYLWQPGLNGGTPSSILGFPIVEAPDMAALGSVVKPIAFGDFRKHYTVVDRLDMQVQRDDFTQAATGAVRFWFRRRVGGQAVLAEAMVVGVTT